jgi:hypothetical protein
VLLKEAIFQGHGRHFSLAFSSNLQQESVDFGVRYLSDFLFLNSFQPPLHVSRSTFKSI